MQFAVRALSPSNQIETLRVDAVDLADAKRQIELRRFRPLTVVAAQKSERHRRSRFALLEFSQELIALLDAGLGLIEALEGLLEKETTPEGRKVVEGLLAKLREGQRLSAALRAHDHVFPELFIGLVRAAEGTSDLPKSLARYVEHQTRVDAVRSRIVSASIYPALLLVVGAGVCLFLMGYVVPRFATVYQGSGRSLPWLSQLLLSWGHWVAGHAFGAAVIAVFSAIFVILSLSYGWSSGRLTSTLARFPMLGNKLKIMELSRLYLTLGMLLEGGISVVPAIEMVAQASSISVRDSLLVVRERVSGGEKLSKAFEEQGLATAIALRMLHVGERSGKLGAMLTRSAYFYEAQTARWIERFSRMFEPILMIAIGIVVGLIVVLLYMPIFELAGSLG